VTKERGTDATLGIKVETWLSATGHGEISSFTNPYPANIRHHISIDSNARYPIDFHVHGCVASGHPQVAYTSAASDKWDKQLLQLISHGEADQSMRVSALGSPARVQVPFVQYDSIHSGWTVIDMQPIPEISVDVS
jgi:hypothetical protein